MHPGCPLATKNDTYCGTGDITIVFSEARNLLRITIELYYLPSEPTIDSKLKVQQGEQTHGLGILKIALMCKTKNGVNSDHVWGCRFYNWKPFFYNFFKVSIGRDLGALKGLGSPFVHKMKQLIKCYPLS